MLLLNVKLHFGDKQGNLYICFETRNLSDWNSQIDAALCMFYLAKMLFLCIHHKDESMSTMNRKSSTCVKYSTFY